MCAHNGHTINKSETSSSRSIDNARYLQNPPSIARAVLWGLQRAQPSSAFQSDGPQEKNYCSITPPPLKKEK